MEPQNSSEGPVKKNQTLIWIAAAVILVCCFCALIAIVGFYSFTTIRSVETQELPPFESTVPAFPDSPDFEDGAGEAPEGGLGNDILRNDTWQAVAAAASGQGCDRPIAANSTIEVLQEPDAAGIWLEKWTVVCRSGDEYAYEVEYILDETGATFNITSLPE